MTLRNKLVLAPHYANITQKKYLGIAIFAILSIVFLNSTYHSIFPHTVMDQSDIHRIRGTWIAHSPMPVENVNALPSGSDSNQIEYNANLAH